VNIKVVFMVYNKLMIAKLTCVAVLFCQVGFAQSPWKILATKPSTLGLEQGTISFQTPSFSLQLVKASQTVASLQPTSIPGFDFTPGDSLKVRSSNGMYHLGDINLRLRAGDNKEWTSYSTATNRHPVSAVNTTGNILAAADLSATLPEAIPVQIKRYWETDKKKLTLRFELFNKTKEKVEIGSLGIPMIFNNLLEGKTLEAAHASNVFYDPYTGRDAGYLQVTRLNGHAPSLLVIPYGHTPFEAYDPLLDDPTPRGIVFEGFYEWMVCSRAYAENEWKNAQPWNEPTSIVLQPGETRSFGVQFILSGTPKDIETTLEKNNRPVAVGIPGYVLPQDVHAKLFLNYKSGVQSIHSEPEGALEIKDTTAQSGVWKAYIINGKTWGRARLTITYEDGLVQTVLYKVIKPESAAIADFGHFLTTKQWYENSNDQFNRSPSVITYDNEKKAQVTQDSRAWIAGLSDEGGAGGWLGATMKQLVLPDKAEIDKLQRFINETLWGHIQYDTGSHQYGVRKSLFYYEPDSLPTGTYSQDINFKTWSAWPRKEAESVGRSYNYPHVASAYWVMYRLARNHTGLVTAHEWNWYLENAYNTAIAMVEQAPYYAQFGQMEGTVFYLILKDIRAEGMKAMADKLEAEMKKRAIHWDKLQYPFGSEMPWDSTGQEEVYIWSLFFGYKDKAAVTIDAILGYMPAIPSWAYNGNARRYWDFLYGGKLQRIERMIHHYGSELNAIPVLTEYRQHPGDLYLLRVGYGGVLGGVSNMTEEGFAPCAFHSFPTTLKNDGINGDYGSGFFGYAVNTATYITYDNNFGWLGFGGNVSEENNWITVNITTAAKSAVYIAPAGLWLTLSSGIFKSVAYNKVNRQVKITLAPKDAFTPTAYLKIEQLAKKASTGTYIAEKGGAKQRDMYAIPLSVTTTQVVLYPEKK
jgi:hypothetical protein